MLLFNHAIRYARNSSKRVPDRKVHVANMGPTWVCRPQVGPIKLAVRVLLFNHAPDIGSSTLILLQKKGFFVECGALNGERASNTIHMEHTMGWTGLLIEMDPYFFLQLIAHNRKSHSINACLSPQRKITTVSASTCYEQSKEKQLFCNYAPPWDVSVLNRLSEYWI